MSENGRRCVRGINTMTFEQLMAESQKLYSQYIRREITKEELAIKENELNGRFIKHKRSLKDNK